MATGNTDFWPEGWEFFPEAECSPNEATALLSFGSNGSFFLGINNKSRKPLGRPLVQTTDDLANWQSSCAAEFAQVHMAVEEDFSAWFPENWVGDVHAWLHPLDPAGTKWEKYVALKGMELYYRCIDGIPSSIPWMALNAERWLRIGSKRDAVRVHRLGNRLEIAAIVSHRLIAHNVFQVQTSKDAAYHCMVFYDQCHLSAQHIPIVWEGDADEECWEALRPFVQKLDTSTSHPWSALMVLEAST